MKRMICLMLAMVLMFGLMATPALAVEETTEPQIVETTEPQTVETTTDQITVEQETQPAEIDEEDGSFVTSQECADFIKKHEGFAKYPMWDYGQYSVGYGTRCPDDKLAEYKANGITEEDADALFREFLSTFENEINVRLIEKYNLQLTQQQFDAILSFSYNCGTGWIYDGSSSVFKAITSGADAAEILRSFSLWCTAGGSFMSMLMQRRLAEANMYLNGVYSRTIPSNFSYVKFEGNGGTTKSRVQGYDVNLQTAPNCIATRPDCTFVGWYTDPYAGTKVTVLGEEHKSMTLYAHWVGNDGSVPDDGSCNVTVQVTGNNVNVRSGPGTNYTKVGTLNYGDKITIVKTIEAGGYTWGNYSSGWVALQYTNFDSVANQPEAPETTVPETTVPPTTEPKPTETQPVETKPVETKPVETKPAETKPAETKPAETKPVETKPAETKPAETKPAETKPAKVYGVVQVSNKLNVRSGPGTGYSKVGTLKNNTRVEILEQKSVGSVTWAKISNGWISMQYVKLETTNTGNTSTGNTATTVVGSGTVVNCTQLRIRSGPGTTYSQVGYLARGTKVSFTQYKNVGSVKWGKISNGWVSLDYIKLDSTSSNTAGGSTTTEKTVTGVVIADDFLRIRSGPSTSYAINGYLHTNDKVTITEQKTVKGVVWGKIAQGWISLDYVKLDSSTTTENTGSTKPTTPSTTTPTTTTTITGVIKVSGTLNVRSGAGTSYPAVGKLNNNDKVTITETKTVNGVKWGKISSGWISMDYVTVTQNADTTTNTTTTTDTTTPQTRTVNATTLYVRSTPGMDGKIVSYLYNGTKVTILETKTVDGRQWGRISTGWICLEYTK